MEIKQVKKILGNLFSLLYDIINPVIQDLKLDKNAKILDVGTGEGHMAITLALNNYEVLTGEPESDSSKYAKKDWFERAKNVGIDHLITFKPFNAEKMPFDDNSFDALFVLGALHHIDDKALAFKECYRITKLNGVICIFEPTSNGIKFIKKGDPSHPDAVNPSIYANNYDLSLEVKKNPMFNAFVFNKVG